jgi:hypothetical protein
MTQYKLDKAIDDKWWKNFAYLQKGHQFNLVDACGDLRVGVSCSGDPNVFANITFSEPDNIKTELELIAHRDEMQSVFDAKSYAQDRLNEYPSIQDQLDYIYHNGIAKWKSDMVKPVKDAHPKP